MRGSKRTRSTTYSTLAKIKVKGGMHGAARRRKIGKSWRECRCKGDQSGTEVRGYEET